MTCSNPNCVCRSPSRSALRDPPAPPDPTELSLREHARFVFSHLWWLVMVIGLLVVAVFCTPKASAQCDLDFTNDGWVDQGDIDAFLRVSSEGPCAVQNDGVTPDTLAPPCDSLDFNNDGSIFDPQDFEMFAAAMAGGPCPDGWYPIPRWRDQLRIWLAPSYGSDTNSGIKRELAVATPERAYMLVQDAMYANRPWAVVIPRGEVIVGRFTGQYGSWAHSGTGGKPGYIGADPDDDPSLPRPKINAQGGHGFLGYCGNVRIISLEFEGNGVGNGVHVVGRASDGRSDYVVSDVLVSQFAGGFAFQGEDKLDPMKRIVVSRSASKWCYNLNGHAQGSFASCVDGMLWDTVTLHTNGWNEPLGDHRDVFCHNYYGVSNSENVTWRNSVSAEAAATLWQFRGGKQDADGCLGINGPLGVTFGHAQAEPDDDAAGSLTNSLIIGGGDIAGQPRSFSIGINRADGVTIRGNIIWRESIEGMGMGTGAAFWLQGPDHQTWDISDNDIYDPRMNVLAPNTAPLFRDDRAVGAVPAASTISSTGGNRLWNHQGEDWQSMPSLSTYLDRHGVNVFDPQWAGRTLAELGTRNRRGDWNSAWEARNVNAYWRGEMRPAE